MRPPASRSWCAAALTALGACSLPRPADVLPVDGAPTPDAAPAPDADPNRVTGTSIVRYYTAAGMQTAPEDLSQYTLQALVPDDTATTKFRTVPVTITGPGTFVIDGIPPGTGYYLEATRNGASKRLLYWTDQHVLDLGYPAASRPDVKPFAGSATIAFSISNLARWWSSDYLVAVSTGAASDDGLADLTPAPAPGDTALPSATIDWGLADAIDPLQAVPNALQNDDLVVSHVRTVSVPDGARLEPPIQTATFAGLTTMTGTPAQAVGAFVDAPRTQTSVYSIDPSVLRQAFGPSYRGISLSDFGIACPGADHGASGASSLDSYYPITMKSASLSESLTYPMPYPDTFIAFHQSWLTYTLRTISVPGTTGGGALSVLIKVDELLTSKATGDSVVQPPASLRINGGQSSDQVIAYDGKTPIVLSWTRSIGATYYEVIVVRYSVVGTKLSRDSVASFLTTQTNVSIPSFAFGGNDRYVLTVNAWRTPTTYATGSLRDYQRPTYSAGAITGVLLFSTTCGNGVLDPGEQCDTAGQSAGCDFDCTKPSCGDGVLNASAGEICDVGGNGSTCNSDCTPSVCGDSKLDPVAGEQCDDGNAKDDGNGCTATCLISHTHCGDGVTQTYGEECDDANTVDNDGCTNHCTLPACGDGILQAGEQCDDGNLIDGDGCSSSCTTEP